MSESDYRALLIELGIAEHLLQSTKLDFELLYQRLRVAMRANYFRCRLLVIEHWQLQALGGLTLSKDALLDTATYRDNRGATPYHYIAWTGNPQALDRIKSHDPQALQLKDYSGRTPIHYAAWSGNPQALDWILRHYPHALRSEEDNYFKTPIHYAAWSGNPQALDWILRHYPKMLVGKNNYPYILRTAILYAAWSGNPQALDWIQSHAPEALKQTTNLLGNYRITPIHYAAWSGNPQALDWIFRHDPQALELEDDHGKTPIHYAAWSGNPQALDWIQSHNPQALELQDNDGYTPIHYAARSGNPKALNQALLHQTNPARWRLYGADSTINNTLLEALKTNYTLTTLEGLEKSGMSEAEQCADIKSLSRNRAIKKAKMQFIAFCQGTNQEDSWVYHLPTGLELHRLILQHLLPPGVDVDRVLTEVMQHADKELRMNVQRTQDTTKALALINREIMRLAPAVKEHNTLLGIPLNSIYENSNAKIAAWRELRQLVTQGGKSLAAAICQWENTHARTLARHRNLGSRLFSQGPTQSQCAVQAIKDCLDVKDHSFPRATPQGPS